MTDIPDFLRKRGIREVTDNLTERVGVRASAKLFFTLFNEELRAELLTVHDTEATPKATQGERKCE